MSSSRIQRYRKIGATSLFQIRSFPLILRHRNNPCRHRRSKHPENYWCCFSSSKPSSASYSSMLSGKVPPELCTEQGGGSAAPCTDNNNIPSHTPPPSLPPLLRSSYGDFRFYSVSHPSSSSPAPLNNSDESEKSRSPMTVNRLSSLETTNSH